MNCPRDKHPLVKATRHGIQVETCEVCDGMWLEYAELDELEDKEFNSDELKGSLLVSSALNQALCPVCSEPLQHFDYRMHSLQLDLCPHLHGFWLDGNEDARILELMQKREQDMARKLKAEESWGETLMRLRSKSFAERIKDLFK